MLKQEIIEKITKYFKLTDFEAEKIYEEILTSIIRGVKTDNIVDVVNFGEFIIKFNNGSGNSEYKKTVEFLATPDLEEDINLRFADRTIFPQTTDPIQKTEKPLPTQNEEALTSQFFVSTDVNQELSQENIVTETNLNSVITNEDKSQSVSFDEELKKKREEILTKLSSETTTTTESEKEELDTKNYEVFSSKSEDDTSRQTEIIAPLPQIDIPNQVIPQNVNKIESFTKPQVPTVEETVPQNFSDYFDEVKKTEDKIIESQSQYSEQKEFQTTSNIIPQTVVDLHNELTHKTEILDSGTDEIKVVEQIDSSEGYIPEHVNPDNSYYIWYRDSEANASDTQTMSYEYELLYQATKEAEYKSKLRVYISTFIIFFSLVLALLIFSPLIYKVFFKPDDVEAIEQYQPKDTEQQLPTKDVNSNPPKQEQQQPPAVNNPAPEQNTNITTTDLKADEKQQLSKEQSKQEQPKQEQPKQEQPKQEQSKQEQPKQEQPKQEQPKQEQPKQVQPKQEQPKQKINVQPKIVEGVSKNSMGWADEKLKVIYIQLENGKYTIQESAWDSDTKATKRVTTIEGFKISGLKGNVVKVDLGARGVWFRTRFGEFSSLEDAKQKAEELRNKERLKLQALLFTILLYG